MATINLNRIKDKTHAPAAAANKLESAYMPAGARMDSPPDAQKHTFPLSSQQIAFAEAFMYVLPSVIARVIELFSHSRGKISMILRTL